MLTFRVDRESDAAALLRSVTERAGHHAETVITSQIVQNAVRRYDLVRLGLVKGPFPGGPIQDVATNFEDRYVGAREQSALDQRIDLVFDIHLDREMLLLMRSMPGMYREAFDPRHGRFVRSTVLDGMRRGMIVFDLLSGRFPYSMEAAKRVAAPSFETRLRQAVYACVSQQRFGTVRPPSQHRDEFSEWGRSEEGRSHIANVRNAIGPRLDEDLDVDRLQAYPEAWKPAPPTASTPVRAPTRPAPAKAEPRARPQQAETKKAPQARFDPEGRVHSIDHADLIESADGRFFLAVPEAGLDERARVFIQIGDRHMSIVQNAIHKGHIENLSRVSLECLRRLQVISLVEISNGERRRPVSKHMAIIQDISLDDGFKADLARMAGAKRVEDETWLG